VICFQYRSDAIRVQDALRLQLGKFGLTLDLSKTKLIEFGRFAQRKDTLAKAAGTRVHTANSITVSLDQTLLG
jgi:hypothetical protein